MTLVVFDSVYDIAALYEPGYEPGAGVRLCDRRDGLLERGSTASDGSGVTWSWSILLSYYFVRKHLPSPRLHIFK